MSIRHVIKAIKVKMMLNRLSKAKENAMREFLGLPPKQSWFDECTTRCMTAVKDKCCQIFCPCCVYDVDRRTKRLSCWDSAFLREFIGFLGGGFLTVIMYLLLIYQLDWSPYRSFCFSSFVGFLLSMFLAFSVNVRCFVLLMIPQLFSGKGRMFLLMYGLFLVMNHPIKNFNTNIMVMSQSATCGQELALNKTKELVKAAAAPMQSLMSSVKKVLGKVREFANSLKQVYINCKKVVTEIGSVLKRIADWLSGIVGRCNETMGTPYKKCKAAFNYAEGECKNALPWPLSKGCDVVGLIGNICHVARIGELLCLITEAIKRVVESNFDWPVVNVLDDASKMFDFTVDVNYDFNFTVTQSKSYKQIKLDIQREIVSRMRFLSNFIKITELVMTAAILFIVIKAIMYRTRYLCDERYDNIYITYSVRDLDEKRKEVRKEGILPLNSDESGKYVQSFSATMLGSEKRKLALGIFFFIISIFNAGFYLTCDVGLYYVLFIVAKHFSGEKGQMPTPPHTKLHVSGSGPMANMYKSIISMFDPIADTNIRINAGPCTPTPSEPDWIMYDQIGTIYLLCLILTIVEPYGLRLRHMIMGCYFPKRERQRAVWLYNHIVKCRGGIVDRAKKRMQKSQFGSINVQHVSLMGQLAACSPFLERLFKWLGWEVKNCLYCGREGKPDDYMNFVHCAFADCDAIYCIDCFADLKNVCAVCSNSIELDGSDASEERDSSMDEAEKTKLRSQREYREGRIQQIKEARRPSKVMLGFRQMIGGEDITSVAHKTTEPEEHSDSESSEEITPNTDRQITSQSKDRSQNNLRIINNVVKRNIDTHDTNMHNQSQNMRYNRSSIHIKESSEITLNDLDISDTESLVSSCSSVDSNDLDYTYQYTHHQHNSLSLNGALSDIDDEFEYDTTSEDCQLDKNNNQCLDKLVSSNIYSSSDTDTQDSDDDETDHSEPDEIILHRT